MSSQMLAAHAKVQKAFKEQTDNVNKEEKKLLLAVRFGPKAFAHCHPLSRLSLPCLHLLYRSLGRNPSTFSFQESKMEAHILEHGEQIKEKLNNDMRKIKKQKKQRDEKKRKQMQALMLQHMNGADSDSDDGF